MKAFATYAIGPVAGMLVALCACGGTTDADRVATNVPFPPAPTPPPAEVLCGRDPNLNPPFEECDINDTTACAEGESCVCCVCGGDRELGDRTFVIAPSSEFLSSAIQSNVIQPGSFIEGDPLILRAGALTPPSNPTMPFADECTTTLSLAEDAVFGFDVLDTSTVCVKLFAAGSSGVLDCDGGTAQDVTLEQDSNGPDPGFPPVIMTEQGEPASAGAATLMLRVTSVRLPADYSSADCPNVDYDNPFAFDSRIQPSDVIDVPGDAFTTETASARILNASGVTPNPFIEAPADGPFICGRWTEAGSPGALVAPIPGEDAPIVGDVANLLLLKEQ
jgi:hypothetical protein